MQSSTAMLGRYRTTSDVLTLCYVLIALSCLSFVLAKIGLTVFFSPFVAWIELYTKEGLVQGYYATGDVYPPLAFTTLAAIAWAAEIFGVTPYMIYKFVQLLALFASALLVYFWRRDLQAAALMLIALAANSIIFESIDILYTPALIGALLALAARRYGLFSLAYSIALILKWQPILIAPMLFIWAWPDLSFRRVLFAILPPALLVFGLTAVVFGPDYWLTLLKGATVETSFSANALNANRVVGWLYAVIAGRIPLYDGGPEAPFLTYPAYQTAIPSFLWLASKVVSTISYGLIAFIFALAERTTTNLFRACALGSLSYFMLHAEVHENHIHVAIVCLGLLQAVDRRFGDAFIFWSSVQAINLLAYISGWPRTVAGVDVTVALSLINMIVFGFMYGQCLLEGLLVPKKVT